MAAIRLEFRCESFQLRLQNLLLAGTPPHGHRSLVAIQNGLGPWILQQNRLGTGIEQQSKQALLRPARARTTRIRAWRTRPFGPLLISGSTHNFAIVQDENFATTWAPR